MESHGGEVLLATNTETVSDTGDDNSVIPQDRNETFLENVFGVNNHIWLSYLWSEYVNEYFIDDEKRNEYWSKYQRVPDKDESSDYANDKMLEFHGITRGELLWGTHREWIIHDKDKLLITKMKYMKE